MTAKAMRRSPVQGGSSRRNPFWRSALITLRWISGPGMSPKGVMFSSWKIFPDAPTMTTLSRKAAPLSKFCFPIWQRPDRKERAGRFRGGPRVTEEMGLKWLVEVDGTQFCGGAEGQGGGRAFASFVGRNKTLQLLECDLIVGASERRYWGPAQKRRSRPTDFQGKSQEGCWWRECSTSRLPVPGQLFPDKSLPRMILAGKSSKHVLERFVSRAGRSGN